MGTQQFCLKWNNHQTNMLSVFDQLLTNEALVDVTLACEGATLKAHKVVLSACSPFFQALFLENPCKHPIVILKDMRYTDLKAIIEFMYRGEVNVSQDQLSALLKTAETLKVKGLAEVTGDNKQGSAAQSQNPSQPTSSPLQTSPLQSKRKRGRPRRHSPSNSNMSDSEEVPANMKDVDSCEKVEYTVDAPNASIPATSVSQVSDELSVSGPPCDPSEDSNDFDPTEILEQSVTTDDGPLFPDKKEGSNEGKVDTSQEETSVDSQDRPSGILQDILSSYEEQELTAPQDGATSLMMLMNASGAGNFNAEKLSSQTPAHELQRIPDGMSPPSLLPSSFTSLLMPSSSKKGERFRCDICHKDFSTAFTMRRHRVIHNPNFLKYQCTYCPRRFNWADNLRSHIQGIHGIPFPSTRGRRTWPKK